ncbi:MAG TPA: hypothetical protein V6C69_04600 [Trichormus sp.]
MPAVQTDAAAKGQAAAPAPGNGDGEGESPDWKSRVMAGYKGKSPKSTHTLLAKIGGDKAALEIGERHKEKAIDDAMISFVDRMFDSFQNCAYEINRHAAGSELELNWIRPFKQKETVLSGWRNKQQDMIEVLSGRLSTRQWTLVVRGTPNDGISIHILPVDKLISFGTNQSDFKVYLTLSPLVEGLGVKWTVDDGQEITVEKYSDIFRELFESLIRHARGRALVDERFNLKAIGMEPRTQEVNVNLDDVQRQYQEAFFEDMRKRAETSRPELLSSPLQKRGLDGRPDPLNRPPQPNPASQSNANGAAYNSGQNQAIPDQRMQQPPYVPPPVPPGYMPSPNSWHGQQMPQAPQMVPPGQPMYPPQMNPSYPPQQAQQGGYPPAPPMPPQNPQQQGMQPQQGMPPQGMQQQGMPPQGMQPQGMQSQGMQPQQGVPPQGMQPQHMQPQGMPPQGMQPQGMQSQGMQPQQGVPPQGMQQFPYGQQPQPPGQQPQQAVPNQNVSFPVALSMLLPTLDRELEVVAKAGMDAFSQRDLVRADAALKFSGRLSEFRALALEILDYYKRK